MHEAFRSVVSECNECGSRGHLLRAVGDRHAVVRSEGENTQKPKRGSQSVMPQHQALARSVVISFANIEHLLGMSLVVSSQMGLSCGASSQQCSVVTLWLEIELLQGASGN